MSAFGGKADVIQGVAKCPLIAKSGHIAANHLTQPLTGSTGAILMNGTGLVSVNYGLPSRRRPHPRQHR